MCDADQSGGRRPARSTSQRGLTTYDELTDDYGASIKVTESSAVQSEGEDRGPWVWLFVEGGQVANNNGSAHLGPEQARRVRDALDTWLQEEVGTPSLRAKLHDMTLHDDTGDPSDEGYMRAVTELREWMEERSDPE